MPARILVDNGVHEFFVRDDEDYYHICQNCEEYFETTRPLPHEEARFCGECCLYAAKVITRWWRKRLVKSI